MINLNTGELNFNEVKITPNMKIADFLQYNESVINIYNRGNGRAIITLCDCVSSNGINAKVKIEINEELNMLKVNILPSMYNSKDINLAMASVKWLEGMITENTITIDKPEVAINRSWGYISIQCFQDKYYGFVGGDIVISYSYQLEV